MLLQGGLMFVQGERKKAIRIFENGTRSSSCPPSTCKTTIRSFTKAGGSRENDDQTMMRFLEGLESKEGMWLSL